jgi:hypothetical protein
MLERVSIVGFFGILVPGFYLLLSLCLALLTSFAASRGEFGKSTLELLRAGPLVITTMFLFVAYLLGMLLRLIGPDPIEWLSRIWFRTCLARPVNRDNLWMFERFPYRHTTQNSLKKKGMSKINDLMRAQNARYAFTGNTSYFNFCKIFIEGNNTELSRTVQHAEATVRFLAGSLFALALSFVVWAFVAPLSVSRLGMAPLLMLPVNLALAIPIIHRFKRQRLREVYFVWSAMYLILVEAVPTKAPDKGAPLWTRIRMA